MSGCINIVKIYKGNSLWKYYLKLEYIEDFSKIRINKHSQNYHDWAYVDFFSYDSRIRQEIHEAFTYILRIIYTEKLIIENMKALEKILRRVYGQYGHDYYWNSRSNVNNADYPNKHCRI